MPAPPPAAPVVDLFAGCGGLGEGFAAVGRDAAAPWSDGSPRFRVALSVEKNPAACATARLRGLFHAFPPGSVPDAYYDVLRGEVTPAELFDRFPAGAAAAGAAVWEAELGRVDPAEADARVAAAVGGRPDWVLCGGPPCQAYSVVGRSRVGGIDPADVRVRLYREFVRVLAAHAPPVFVMENVTGLLSAKVEGERVFDALRADLGDPPAALARWGNGRSAARPAAGGAAGYRLHAVAGPARIGGPEPADFVAEADRHGVPQARRRVILVGVRADLSARPRALPVAAPADRPTVADALAGLPAVRSGLSKEPDGAAEWVAAVSAAAGAAWWSAPGDLADVRDRAAAAVRALAAPPAGRGGPFVPGGPADGAAPGGRFGAWVTDGRVGGAATHEARAHRRDDLHRDLFCAAHAAVSRKPARYAPPVPAPRPRRCPSPPTPAAAGSGCGRSCCWPCGCTSARRSADCTAGTRTRRSSPH